MIQIDRLTKRFSNGRGIFDLHFAIEEGEVFGYLGPNGAGKTTTIRHLLGFFRPTSGKISIAGMDSWRQAAQIQKRIGYLPGEIALLESGNGRQLIQLIADMRRLKDTKRQYDLIERFQLDPQVPIRKMSKGMKQKVAIVIAFMHDPDILILDEPTSGLDPLMQKTFIELILEEKKRGKTMLMSSHQFQEIERTCDRVGMIKDGRLIAINQVSEVQKQQRKVLIVTLSKESEVEILRQAEFTILHQEGVRVELLVEGDYNSLFQSLASCEVRNLDMHHPSIEETFMDYYEATEEEGK